MLADADADERAREAVEPAHVLAAGPLGGAARRQAVALDRAHEAGAADRGVVAAAVAAPRVGQQRVVGAEGLGQRRLERERVGLDGALDWVVARDHVVPEARHERAGERARAPRDEADPERRQPRRDERDAEHGPLDRHHLGRLLHHLAVAQHVRPRHVEGARERLRPAEHEPDGADDVAQRDRLRVRVGPRREHHRREPPDEVDEDPQRRAAGADDEAGAERRHGHAVGGERLLDLVAAAEVAREVVGVLGQQPAEVHDLAEPLRRRGAREVVGEDEVEVGEGALRQPRRRQHRVDEVHRHVGAGEGALDGEHGVQVAVAPLGRVAGVLPRGAVGRARQPDDAVARGELGAERGAHEPARAGHGDGQPRGLGRELRRSGAGELRGRHARGGWWGGMPWTRSA